MSEDWEEDGNPWRIDAVRRVYENGWFAIDEHDGVNPAGKPATYGVIRVRRRAVGVLPIDAQGMVHLVGQWRFPLARYSWEMPEGGVEPGEASEACARRELQEETGLRAARLVKILTMDLSNSLTDEECDLYLATELTPGPDSPEEVEILKRRVAPFSEVVARAAEGKITDSLTVAALFRAHHMAVTGELPDALARVMLG